MTDIQISDLIQIKIIIYLINIDIFYFLLCAYQMLILSII